MYLYVCLPSLFLIYLPNPPVILCYLGTKTLSCCLVSSFQINWQAWSRVRALSTALAVSRDWEQLGGGHLWHCLSASITDEWFNWKHWEVYYIQHYAALSSPAFGSYHVLATTKRRHTFKSLRATKDDCRSWGPYADRMVELCLIVIFASEYTCLYWSPCLPITIPCLYSTEPLYSYVFIGHRWRHFIFPYFSQSNQLLMTPNPCTIDATNCATTAWSDTWRFATDTEHPRISSNSSPPPLLEFLSPCPWHPLHSRSPSPGVATTTGNCQVRHPWLRHQRLRH